MSRQRSTPRTQKAAGILNGLYKLRSHIGNAGQIINMPEHFLVQNEYQVHDVVRDCGYTRFFARPCPKTPRHGFVESRLVNTAQEIEAILKETLQEDPDGELLLAPAYSEVKFNAIYTSFGSLSVGPGNDGATAGKDAVQFAVAPFDIPEEVRKVSKLGAEDHAYLEMIYMPYGTDNYPYLVQMRGGPAVETSVSDFIPQTVTISKVVEPVDDLLTWAKMVEKFEPGTVVWAKGHTLASHAAVHCVIHKVPFITSQEPRVGETLQPLEASQQKPLSRTNFKNGLRAGISDVEMKRDEMNEYLTLVVSVLHNWAYIRNNPHAATILGSSMAFLAKICSALVLGEFRHKKTGTTDCGLSHDRNKVYSQAVKCRDTSCIQMMTKALSSFQQENWASGFGGHAWALCAYYSLEVWNAAMEIFHGQSPNIQDEEITRLIQVFNAMVNLSHNNGWWFNKISSMNVPQMVADNPGIMIARMAPLLWKITKFTQKPDADVPMPSSEYDKTYILDKRKGACCMYIAKENSSWVVFRTQAKFERSKLYKFTDAQKNIIATHFAKADKIKKLYLTPTPDGKFKLGDLTVEPPCKLEAAV